MTNVTVETARELTLRTIDRIDIKALVKTDTPEATGLAIGKLFNTILNEIMK